MFKEINRVETDSSDEYAVAELKKIADNERDAELDRFRAVLDTYEGRATIWRILEHAGVYTECFVPGSQDVTDYNLGVRSNGLWLMTEVFTADDKAYILMQSEAMTRAEARREKELPYARRRDDTDD